MKSNNNDGERITLRLEQEDLVLIDEYIEEHPEFSSRSHLARIAIRGMIEGDAKAEQAVESSPKKHMITVEVPQTMFEILEENLKRGEYTSFQAEFEDALRARFMSRDVSAQINAETQLRSKKTYDVM